VIIIWGLRGGFSMAILGLSFQVALQRLIFVKWETLS
jgi:hypothetical protein